MVNVSSYGTCNGAFTAVSVSEIVPKALSPTAPAADVIEISFSAAMIVSVLILFFFAQRYFIEGIVLSGLKG